MSPIIPSVGQMTVARLRELRETGMADFSSACRTTNARRIQCRVCREACEFGEAVGYDEFMSDGYRSSQKYGCRRCFNLSTPTK